MDIVNLIISLVSGLVGGNAAGAAMPDKGLGTVGNSVTGLLGGATGGYVAQLLGLVAAAAAATGGQAAAPGTGPDLVSLIANVASSGVGGAVLTLVAALVKNYFKKV